VLQNARLAFWMAQDLPGTEPAEKVLRIVPEKVQQRCFCSRSRNPARKASALVVRGSKLRV
jgi:hypothetical protein